MEFFFDPISPNAYLAWHVLPRLAEKYEREITLKPVLFAGLLQAYDQAGPAEVAPKMKWMIQNCLYKADELGIEFNPPHSHPFNPLLLMRLMLSVVPEQRIRLLDILINATWVQGVNVSDAATVADLLRNNGYDAPALMHLASSDAIKRRLRMDTELAISRGVFGVPTIIADKELFFGFDDLPWLERYLAGDLLAGKTVMKSWNTLQPSALRRRR